MAVEFIVRIYEKRLRLRKKVSHGVHKVHEGGEF
jgi:hypothetical protein